MAARANVHAFRASVHEQLQNFGTLDHFSVAQEEVFERNLELEVKNAIWKVCCVLALETSSPKEFST